MLLALDIGNTSVRLGLFSAEELRRAWRIADSRLADEPHLGLVPEEREAVQAIVACSVAPSVLEVVCSRLEKLRAAPMRLVQHAGETGIPTRYGNPETLGVDRLVGCRAARDLYGVPCLVVDLGTAMTFDAVSAAGEHLGGAIAPGLRTSARALTAKAELLPDFEPAEGAAAIATSTLAGLNGGFVLGFAGMIDQMVRRIRQEMGIRAQAIATGGDATLVIPHCREIDTVDEALTLQGLRLIYQSGEV